MTELSRKDMGMEWMCDNLPRDRVRFRGSPTDLACAVVRPRGSETGAQGHRAAEPVGDRSQGW
jgi:hypothetical protein